jgi:hypothetical protein
MFTCDCQTNILPCGALSSGRLHSSIYTWLRGIIHHHHRHHHGTSQSIGANTGALADDLPVAYTQYSRIASMRLSSPGSAIAIFPLTVWKLLRHTGWELCVFPGLLGPMMVFLAFLRTSLPFSGCGGGVILLSPGLLSRSSLLVKPELSLEPSRRGCRECNFLLLQAAIRLFSFRGIQRLACASGESMWHSTEFRRPAMNGAITARL